MIKKFILLGLFVLPQAANACQLQLFKSNKTDHHGERNGRWKFYLDETKNHLYRKGKFKHGHEVGIWKYFDEAGNLRKVEQYSKNRKVIFTKNFYANGTMESTGKAFLLNENGSLHYYWSGIWLFFNPQGSLIKTANYQYGKEIK